MHVFARRGPAQVKFSPLELRELGHVPDVDVLVDPEDFEFDEGSERAIATSNQTKQVVKTLTDWTLKEGESTASRRLHLHFLHAPVEVLTTDGHVSGLRTERTRLRRRRHRRGHRRPPRLGRPGRLPRRRATSAPRCRASPSTTSPGVISNHEGRVLAPEGEHLAGRLLHRLDQARPGRAHRAHQVRRHRDGEAPRRRRAPGCARAEQPGPAGGPGLPARQGRRGPHLDRLGGPRRLRALRWANRTGASASRSCPARTWSRPPAGWSDVRVVVCVKHVPDLQSPRSLGEDGPPRPRRGRRHPQRARRGRPRGGAAHGRGRGLPGGGSRRHRPHRRARRRRRGAAPRAGDGRLHRRARQRRGRRRAPTRSPPPASSPRRSPRLHAAGPRRPRASPAWPRSTG